jgi:hypothetical protein
MVSGLANQARVLAGHWSGSEIRSVTEDASDNMLHNQRTSALLDSSPQEQGGENSGAELVNLALGFLRRQYLVIIYYHRARVSGQRHLSEDRTADIYGASEGAVRKFESSIHSAGGPRTNGAPPGSRHPYFGFGGILGCAKGRAQAACYSDSNNSLPGFP